MIARAERVTNHHKLRLYRTAAIISYKPQPLRTNIEHITHIQQHLADLSTLSTRALIPHIQALHSSHPPPHTNAHQSAPPQVDSKHPQVSCAHKGSKEITPVFRCRHVHNTNQPSSLQQIPVVDQTMDTYYRSSCSASPQHFHTTSTYFPHTQHTSHEEHLQAQT